MTEVENASAGSENVERLADRNVKRATPTRYANEEGVDDPSALMADGFVALATEGPVEDGGGVGKRLEIAVGRVGKRERGFGHRRES